jgi:hypothetical protein
MLEKVAKRVRELLVSLGWVGGSLLFSFASIGIIIGIAWLIKIAFPFLPNSGGALGLFLAFVIYLIFAGWVAWRLLMRWVSKGPAKGK